MKYVKESLNLDFTFLTKIKLSFLFKVWIIICKYFIFVINAVTYSPGKSHSKVFGFDFYFPNKFGILSMQRVYDDNYFLKNYIPENVNIIDVGAHVGEFNLFSRNYLKANKVVSFEPFKNSFNVLSKNIKEDIHNYAISDKNEEKFYVSRISTQLNSFNPSNTEGVLDEVTVQCVQIDNFIQDNYSDIKFDMLKIDVEGAEYKVIQTAHKTIDSVKYVLVEMSVERDSDLGFLGFLAQLKSQHPNLEILALNNYSNGERSIDILFQNNAKD